MPEIQSFQQSLESVHKIGDPVLDDLSISERTQRRANILHDKVVAGDSANCEHSQPAPGGATYVASLCARDIEYLTNIADPPSTRAMRQALQVLDKYAETLNSLANGGNPAAAAQQVTQLVDSIAAAAEAAGVATGIGAPVAGALKALQSALQEAARQAAVNEARRLIEVSDKPVSDLIVALRGAIPEMSRTIAEPTKEALGNRKLAPGEVSADIARLDAYKTVLANYDAMLRQANEAWREVVRANITSAHLSLADAASRAAQLKSDVDAANKALSLLRVGATLAGA